MNSLTCPFCREFADLESSEFRRFFPEDILPDRVIEPSKNFVALVSLGAIREGFLLILPRSHFLSFSWLSSSEALEAQQLKDRMVELVEKIYSTPIVFEHGIMDDQSSAGGCIDHAHLQIVPCEIDLFPKLSREFSYVPISNLSELSSFRERHQPYLYYEREKRAYAFIIDRDLPSQYMRRIVAEHVGKPDEWDWAVFVGEENILKTARNLRPTIGDAEYVR